MIRFRDWSRFRSTKEIHVTCAALAKVRRNFARWAPRTETYGLIWKSFLACILVRDFSENIERKKCARCHQLRGSSVQSSVLDTRDKRSISISLFLELTLNRTIEFKCFEQSRVLLRLRQEDSRLRTRSKNTWKTRVVEIADDSNKTNFLRELAIETKNLQTDALASAARQDNEIRIKETLGPARESSRKPPKSRACLSIPKKTNPILAGRRYRRTFVMCSSPLVRPTCARKILRPLSSELDILTDRACRI